MNTISLPAPELKHALQGLSKVVPRVATLPALQSIRVTRDATGIVCLQATDLEGFVSYQTEQRQPGPVLDFLVPFEVLSKEAKSAKERLELIPTQEQVIIRCHLGGSYIDKAHDSLSASHFPTFPKVEAKGIPFTPELNTAIRQALACSSTDGMRPALNGACLDTADDKGHYVVGTDARSIFSANSFHFDLAKPLIVPNDKFLLWPGLDHKEGTLSTVPTGEKDAHPSWIKFELQPWTYIAKECVGNYPNWKQCVPGEHLTKVELSPDTVATILLTLPHLPDADHKEKPVELKFGKRSCSLLARDTNIPLTGITLDGPDQHIKLNRNYLAQALRFGLHHLGITDNITPVTFAKEGKRLVVMVLRPDNYQAPADPAPEPVTPQTPPEAIPPAPTKEETTPMTTTAATAPETNTESPIKDALKRIDALKETLKQVLRDLQDTYSLLKQLEKDKKASDKEIASVRDKLRELQQVKI